MRRAAVWIAFVNSYAMSTGATTATAPWSTKSSRSASACALCSSLSSCHLSITDALITRVRPAGVVVTAEMVVWLAREW